jgi:Zn-dependent peptidase ImmA (M78 family)
MDAPDRDVFGLRLRQARERAGLTLRDVEKAVAGKIKYSTIANYEAGRFLPDEANLLTLAVALNQPVDWFFQPARISLGEVRFRKKSSFSAKSRKELEARAESFFENYLEIEELTGESRPYKAPLRKTPEVQSFDEAEGYAEKLRGTWELGCDPVRLVRELLEDKGIKVFETDVEEPGFDGLQAQANDGRHFVIVLNSSNAGRPISIPRRRLTAVHELGHVVLPLDESTHTKESECEKLVWRFAGAFMLPHAPFVSAFGRGRTRIAIDELVQMKVMFGASIWAIMRRAHELALINKASYTRFCIYANSAGWRTSAEPGDELFPELPRNARFCSLVSRAASERLISDSKKEMLIKMAGYRTPAEPSPSF